MDSVLTISNFGLQLLHGYIILEDFDDALVCSETLVTLNRYMEGYNPITSVQEEISFLEQLLQLVEMKFQVLSSVKWHIEQRKDEIHIERMSILEQVSAYLQREINLEHDVVIHFTLEKEDLLMVISDQDNQTLYLADIHTL